MLTVDYKVDLFWIHVLNEGVGGEPASEEVPPAPVSSTFSTTRLWAAPAVMNNCVNKLSILVMP